MFKNLSFFVCWGVFLIHSIRQYLLFLKNKCSLSVSLHTTSYDPFIHHQELALFNLHESSYCSFIKTKSKAYCQCLSCQKKALKKSHTGAFSGYCHAGVFEYVYPISNGQTVVGFVSVSGFQTEKTKTYLQTVSQTYGFSLNDLQTASHSLKNKIPEKTEIDAVIFPLLAMLELAYQKSETFLENNTCFAEQVANFLKATRNQNLTSQDICRHFNCSRTYLSTAFNKHFGQSIRHYITALRIEDAKQLLQHSSLNITEIAYNVGFNDANYFSNIFKKKTGNSPSSYKNKFR